MSCQSIVRLQHHTQVEASWEGETYVPGFWSWKGLVSTVLTLIIAIECLLGSSGGGLGGECFYRRWIELERFQTFSMARHREFNSSND